MPFDYQITLKNKSGNPLVYTLFGNPPSVVGHDDTKPLINPIARSIGPVQTPDGVTVFTIHRQYYAICSTSASPPGDGVPITQTDSKAVTLGRADPPTKASSVELQVEEGYPRLEEPVEEPNPSDPNGGFVFKTKAWDDKADIHNLMIGVGILSPQSKTVVPLALLKAEPMREQKLYPVDKFYISPSKWKPGVMVTSETVIDGSATIDFTGNPHVKCTVTHGESGEFTYEYGV